MTNPSQFIKESVYLDLLRAIDREWPKGKLVKSESPDFILKTGRKRSIGIELTDLTIPDTVHIDSAKRIGEIVQRMNGGNILLQVYFRSEEVLAFPLIEERTAQIVAEEITDTERNLDGTMVITEGLPEEVSMVFIALLPGSAQSIFESKLSMDVRKIDPDLLRSAIQMKEDKIRLYNKKWTDQLWLVLTVSGLLTPISYNLQVKIDQWKIPSSFDRTILFDVTGKKIAEIADF